MSLFDQFMLSLGATMEEPMAFGAFHLLCIGIMVVMILILFLLRRRHSEKQLKIVIGVYGIVAFILELLKQISWSYNYDLTYNIVTWDFTWYSAPFQLCTTPIFVTLICLFLKKGKVRDSLLSYMAFYTIWGSFTTIILPDSCLIDEILINIHTMWLHLGGFVVSSYLLFSNELEFKKDNLYGAIKIFIEFVAIAMILNIGVYNSGILNGETFDMFYISPYFEKSLPVFMDLYKILPYPLYLISYIFILTIGAIVVYNVTKFIKSRFSKTKIKRVKNKCK